MNSNIFMNDSYKVKKPVYEGVERNRDFEKNKTKPKKKKKRK
jgi:hypothetical protein|tara:strand:+ start:8471 stop:8596 length:126 start_codon:yes stop_codon:yes gene_type:complete